MKEKKCPVSKLLNPFTGRCVKMDGRIGRQLRQQCPDGKIWNLSTQRCVKISGKVAKNMLKNQYMHIIFKPVLSLIWNSSYIKSSKSSISYRSKHVWHKANITNFCKWYQNFADVVRKKLKQHHIDFVAFRIYNTRSLQLIVKHTDIDVYKSSAIKFALGPDVNEDHLIVMQDKLYIVENFEIIAVK